jgi:DNA replication protein DnaC
VFIAYCRATETPETRCSEWASVFGDAKMTTAFLDRLTHRCQIPEIGNESYSFTTSSETAKKKQRAIPALTPE